MVLRSGSQLQQQQQCWLSTSRSAAAVAMSKFDAQSEMPYEKLLSKLKVVREKLNRPLTLSEKILYSHLDDPANQVLRATQLLLWLCLLTYLKCVE